MAAERDNWLPTRQSLISKLKHWDDNESWRRFFETYSRLLFSFARRSGFDDAEAQDIVQETVISVAKHIPNFQYDPARGTFKSWLLRIARSRIVDHIRARQRQPPRDNPLPGDTSQTAFIHKVPDPKAHDIDVLWDEEWDKHLLATALEKVKERVSDKDFQIFDCHVLKQWPVKDVVALLKVTDSYVYTAKSRVSGVLKKTLKELEERMA